MRKKSFLILFFAIVALELGVMAWVYSVNRRVDSLTTERTANLENLDVASSKLALLRTIEDVRTGYVANGTEFERRTVFRSHEELAAIYQDFLAWLERNDFVAEEVDFTVSTVENVERYVFTFRNDEAECTLELQDENYPAPLKTYNYYMTFSCGS